MKWNDLLAWVTLCFSPAPCYDCQQNYIHQLVGLSEYVNKWETLVKWSDLLVLWVMIPSFSPYTLPWLLLKLYFPGGMWLLSRNATLKWPVSLLHLTMAINKTGCKLLILLKWNDCLLSWMTIYYVLISCSLLRSFINQLVSPFVYAY